MYNIDKIEQIEHQKEPKIKEKITPLVQPNEVLICDDLIDQEVFFYIQLPKEQEDQLKGSCSTTKMCFPSLQITYAELKEAN